MQKQLLPAASWLNLEDVLEENVQMHIWMHICTDTLVGKHPHSYACE